MTALQDGGFVVTWESENQDGDDWDVYGQIFGAIGTASGGDAEGDALTSIENLVGSDHADTLTGDGGANVLEGGAGADRLDGGEGVDTASWAGSSAAVTVNLAMGTASGDDAEGDTLASIENLIGSGYNDTLTGGDGAAGLL